MSLADDHASTSASENAEKDTLEDIYGHGDVTGNDLMEDDEQELSNEALETYKAAQERTGVIYLSRIPPGMSPNKVRHLLSAYGEIGRVYLQQEDAKRAYLRKKHTTSKKPHYTEGWVEFSSKKIARSVAGMLNARPIGGKKGTRWAEDLWNMKYLPRFKWYMLTEQIAHERADHAARLRLELSQSKREQKHYLKQVEIGRSLEKREEKRKRKREDTGIPEKDVQKEEEGTRVEKIHSSSGSNKLQKKEDQRQRFFNDPQKPHMQDETSLRKKQKDLDAVLGSIF